MLLSFKVVQLLCIVAFVVVISDHRRQLIAAPVLNKGIIRFTKACYPFPILAWMFSVLMASSLEIRDWLALIISVFATSLTFAAKRELGQAHVWAGYFRADTVRVSSGVYRVFSHPMYVGIVSVMVAGTLFMFNRLPHPVFIGVVASEVWITGFLVVTARRETRFYEQLRRAKRAVAEKADAPAETALVSSVSR